MEGRKRRAGTGGHPGHAGEGAGLLQPNMGHGVQEDVETQRDALEAMRREMDKERAEMAPVNRSSDKKDL
ncbi:MAG: hypothetical protein GY731_11810 [Gammaproteobacteria bacterium]|nr:hypothetical protein [Gammaproteobacteria bacterium]